MGAWVGHWGVAGTLSALVHVNDLRLVPALGPTREMGIQTLYS